jgi:hypothetical protein
MHLKVFLKLKTPKTLSSGQICKKLKKQKNNKENQKKTTGLVFLKPGFIPNSNPG